MNTLQQLSKFSVTQSFSLMCKTSGFLYCEGGVENLMAHIMDEKIYSEFDTYRLLSS